MIHIAKGLKILFLGGRRRWDDEWAREMDERGGKLQALLIEAIDFPDEPMCPQCLHGIEDDLPPAGAGLIICPYCAYPCLVLRFLGGPGGTVWYSFPWPKE